MVARNGYSSDGSNKKRYPSSDTEKQRVRDENDIFINKDESSSSVVNESLGGDNLKQNQQANMERICVCDNASSTTQDGGGDVPGDIQPFKLARLTKGVHDKANLEYQHLMWDAMKKIFNELVDKVSPTNIKMLIPEILSENLVSGRGLFCRILIKSQMASPASSDVFAALVAVVNSKFPQIGYLLCKRIVLQVMGASKRKDKPQLLASFQFMAHLVNQRVLHGNVALELLSLLFGKPTQDTVEIAVDFVTQCGPILQQRSLGRLYDIFGSFGGILREGRIDQRVRLLIEGLFTAQKAMFKGHPVVPPELDLVEQEVQITHKISVLEHRNLDPETNLDFFEPDPDFLKNEKIYDYKKKNILGYDYDEIFEDEEADQVKIKDETGTSVVNIRRNLQKIEKIYEDVRKNILRYNYDEKSDDENEEDRAELRDGMDINLEYLRRFIYLAIMSSADSEEASHKLSKIKLEPGQEMQLCIILLECCSRERIYLRYHGLLGQKLCMMSKVHQENFERSFVQQYSMIHHLETNKLHNIAKFFAHLLGTDALPWHVLINIHLTVEKTTSSSRIFIKTLFQELSELLGIHLLVERLDDPSMEDSCKFIFPKDSPENIRLSINFFTSIGLGCITKKLIEYYRNMAQQ